MEAATARPREIKRAVGVGRVSRADETPPP